MPSVRTACSSGHHGLPAVREADQPGARAAPGSEAGHSAAGCSADSDTAALCALPERMDGEQDRTVHPVCRPQAGWFGQPQGSALYRRPAGNHAQPGSWRRGVRGLQNLTGQMAQIYKLQDGKRVAVETINPKETKPIEDDDQVKFDVLTLWIEKIEVTKL